MRNEASSRFGPRVFGAAAFIVLAIAAWLLSANSDSTGSAVALVGAPATAVGLFYGGIAWSRARRGGLRARPRALGGARRPATKQAA